MRQSGRNSMLRKPAFIDWLTLAGLVVAWGSSFVMTKIAVAQLDASWIMALRLCIAGAFLVCVLMVSGSALPKGRGLWTWFASLGLLGHAAPFFLITWGTRYVSSGVSGVLMGAIPLLVIVFAHFFLPDEPVTPPKALGFTIGLAGLIIVLGPEKLGSFSAERDAFIGELAILAGCVCYAAHGLLARRIPFKGPLEQSAAVCLAGGAMGLVFASVVSPHGLAGAPWHACLAVAGLGILPTAIGTLLMYRIMRTVGVSFVAYSNYLVPVYALAFGALTLGETLHWTVALGLALILAGIAASRLNFGKAGVPAK
jgi:drug/metabolite transporter (DMT)-like permease